MSALLWLVDLVGLIGGLGLVWIVGNHLRLAMTHGPLARHLLATPPPVLEPGANAPLVTVQIPVFNEPLLVEAALDSAAALDWPRDRLLIQLLDDSTDETTAIAAAVVARLSETGRRVQHLRRKDRSGFKAGALAAGVAASDAAYFALLDADHRAPVDWLKRAVGLLESDRQAAFAQFRFEFANRDTTLLTRLQQLLADSHFIIEQTGRHAAGEPFQFNGTAAVWRRSALEAAGGWSADTLAEDLDLVLRVYESGGRGILALQPPILCEAPETLAAWRVQQARWSKGFSQAATKLLARVWRTDWPIARKLGASALLCLQMALPSALLVIAAFFVDMALRGPSALHLAIGGPVVAFLVLTLVAITWPAYRALHRGGVLDYASTLVALPPLFGLLALSSTPAIAAGLAGREGEFVRTPKTGAVRKGP